MYDKVLNSKMAELNDLTFNKNVEKSMTTSNAETELFYLMTLKRSKLCLKKILFW